MNSKSTIQIMRELSGGEYSDPFLVRAAISRDGMRPDSFAVRFWRALHMSGACPLTETFRTQGAEGVAAALPKGWSEDWENRCKENGVQPTQLTLVDYLYGICVKKPLCRPCRCKDRVISFLAQTLGGDEKARNAAKRNVSNWLTDKLPLDRETYIKLCYALGLRALGEGTEEEKARSADRFLSLCCAQNPLHLSDAEEAVHHYCLRYPLGQELPAEEDYSGTDNYSYALSLIERIGTAEFTADDSWMFTAEAGAAVDRLRSEEDILAYAQSCRSHQSDEYYTAKCVLGDFMTAYEDELAISGEKSKRMRAGVTKEEARRTIAAFEQLDCDTSALEDISRYAGRLADVLYASAAAEEIVSGRRPMSRTVLLLCLLAQNCGAVFSSEQMDMVQTDDFTDVRSFNEFFRMLNATLNDCSMAPMNPHRRLDFLILYSYFLFSRGAMMGEMPDAFSVYMARAVERVTAS